MDEKKRLTPKVKRKKKKIWGDPSRVITRPHIPDGAHRILKIIQRIADLSDTTAEDLLAQIMLDFSERHKDIRRIFERSLNEVRKHVSRDVVLSKTKQALIGAYFTMEYAIEYAKKRRAFGSKSSIFRRFSLKSRKCSRKSKPRAC
mgnify:CR=1 FL=1